MPSKQPNVKKRTVSVFHDLFEMLDEYRLKKDKVEILKLNDNNLERAFFVLAYHPNVQWVLPEGAPPYKPNQETMEGRGFMNLKKNMSQFNLFLKGRGYDNRPMARREMKFIQMLESVTPKEAEWIIQCKDRKLKNCSENVVREAYPDLLPPKDAT